MALKAKFGPFDSKSGARQLIGPVGRFIRTSGGWVAWAAVSADGLPIPWQNESIHFFWSPLPAASEPAFTQAMLPLLHFSNHESFPVFHPCRRRFARLFCFMLCCCSGRRFVHKPRPLQPLRRPQQPYFNYGYDRSHRVTPSERTRWEAAHRDAKDDRKDARRDYKDDVKDARRDYKDDIKDARRDYKDDRNSKDYGYDRSHRVSAQERARWEAAHRYEGRR